MIAVAVWGGLSAAQPAAADPSSDAATAVGVHSFVITDPARTDPVSTGHRREWRVDVYYPARADARGVRRSYASDRALMTQLATKGYYDVPPNQLQAWQRKPGPALVDAAAAESETPLPLIVILPGSGVAAFNYSQLAAALVAQHYAVAVVDLPYLGVSLLPDGRFLDPGDDSVQRQDDPRSWRPRVREWSADVSLTLDRLLAAGSSSLPAGLAIDSHRLVITGHSLGGTVALQVCGDDPRVEGCGDFEGAPDASDVFDRGTRKPVFVTAARSAKPDRPFKRPDLSEPFWSYLAKDGPSAWAIAITRASHMSYSDAPFEMPDTLSRFGGELMTPERSFEVYVRLVDSFARAYAPSGRGDCQFGGLLESIPEILARRNQSAEDTQPTCGA